MLNAAPGSLRKVKEIENVWITMSDGIRLAARIWLPEDAVEKQVPAILEYLPYRKRDGTHVRDQLTHPYFAGGYACPRRHAARRSEGLMFDEYEAGAG
jgi:predicted acyl esterase